MSNDLKDILANSNKDIDNQQLMDYLSHHLPHAEEHEVEKNMADDPFVNDAVEGLQQMGINKNLSDYVNQLNNDLQIQIAKSKKRKNKRRWKDNPQTYIALVAILIILMICFILLKKYLDARQFNNAGSGTQINSKQNKTDKSSTVKL